MKENNKKITSKQLLFLADLMEKQGVDPAKNEYINELTRYQADLLIKEYLGKNR